MTSNSHITNLLNSDGQLPAETLEWLRTGMVCHLETGASLEKCLGIDRREYLRMLRDQHLFKAFQCFGSRRSKRYRYGKLLEKIDSVEWEKESKKLINPDPIWPDLDTEIFYALQCYPHIPKSVRMIENIVKKCEIEQPPDFVHYLGKCG